MHSTAFFSTQLVFASQIQEERVCATAVVPVAGEDGLRAAQAQAWAGQGFEAVAVTTVMDQASHQWLLAGDLDEQELGSEEDRTSDPGRIMFALVSGLIQDPERILVTGQP